MAQPRRPSHRLSGNAAMAKEESADFHQKGPLDRVIANVEAEGRPDRSRPSAKGISWRSALPQVLVSCAALSLTVHAGVNMAFTAIMIPQLQDSDSAIRVDRDSASWIAAVVAVTTPVGSLLAGPLMDWAGRRAACLATAGPLLLAWLILPLAAQPGLLDALHLGADAGVDLVYASRALAGVGAGLTTAAGVYVAEVSHPSVRPALLCLNSVFVAAGILLTSFLGLWMDWSRMAFVFAGLVLVSAGALLFAPESPHWLLSMAPGKQLEQRTALARRALRQLNKDDQVFEASWDRLTESAAQGRPAARETAEDAEGQHLLGRRVFRSASAFLQPATARPMLVLGVLFLAQQLSGTYVIIFYAVPLFSEIGSRIGTVVDEFGVMVIMSAIRFVMSVATALLSQRFGRRPMMLVSGLGMAACSVAAGATLVTAIAPRDEADAVGAPSSIFGSDEVFAASWPPLVFVLLFVMFSSLGYLVMPWTLVSELLPLESRAMGSALLVSLAYLLMFGVVKSFPFVMAMVGARNVFYSFGATACVGSAFVYLCLPETLGKTFAEIERHFVKLREEF